MKSLRVSPVLAAILLLSATKLSAQSSRVACKDGSSPKAGHFACWGHGGLVSGVAKSAVKADATTAGKAAKKSTAASKAKKPTAKKWTAKKPTAKKSHATLAKSRKKTHPKRPATHVEK
jgi:hypothetical protein